MTGPRIPNLFAVPELKEKLLFTLLALTIYRLGAHIATPGVDVQVLADFIRNQGAQTLFGVYDMFVGGGLSRATVLAHGRSPTLPAVSTPQAPAHGRPDSRIFLAGLIPDAARKFKLL